MKLSKPTRSTAIAAACFSLLCAFAGMPGRANAAVSCEVSFVLQTNTTLGSLQFDADYSATSGHFIGLGGNVDCTTDVEMSVSEQNDEGGPKLLHWGILNLSGIDGPTSIGHCSYSGPDVPLATDFVVTETDSTLFGTGTGLNANLCGAPTTGSSPPYSRDAWVVLRRAVDPSVICQPCECDTDNNGLITSLDALAVLRRAIGLSGTNSCPACGGAPVPHAPFTTGVSVQAVVDCAGPCQPTADPSCGTGTKSSVIVADSADDFNDSIKWKLGGGPETTQIDLGDPEFSNTTYYLCVYDTSGGGQFLATQLTIPASENWSNKDPKGLGYKDSEGLSDGVTKIGIKTGAAGASKVQVIAKGLSLPMPAPASGTAFFNAAGPIVVELRSTASPLCWSSSFPTPTVNSVSKYSAKTP